MDALLENAIRHTCDGDLIQLSVTGGNGPVRIAVSDTGSGIEAGELAHVFDRFRTGPNAKGPGGPGSVSRWCARSPTRTAGRRGPQRAGGGQRVRDQPSAAAV